MNTKIEPIEMLIQAEDQVIRLQCEDANKAQITVRDTMSGEQKTFDVTTGEAGAIMALLIGGDQYDAETGKLLYDLAEPVFKGIPNNLRPIP